MKTAGGSCWLPDLWDGGKHASELELPVLQEKPEIQFV